MNYIKKAALLFLTAAMIFTLFSCTTADGEETSVSAEDTAEEEIKLYEYEVEDGGAVITYCRLLATNLEVPSELDGIPVTAIGDGVFQGIENMETAVIPEGVTSIGASAFEGCTLLKEVTLPSTLKEIKERAFKDTPWFESLSDEFTIVGDGVAIKYSGNDTEVTVPDNVKYLSDAFTKCDSVTAVTLSEGVEIIGDRAFSGMKSLDTVTIPSSVRSIGNYAFSFCMSLKEITIPETVTELGEFVFSRCSALENAEINAKAKVLRMAFFANCTALKTVVIPDTLTTIENAVFENCPSLTSVNLPASLTEIAPGAFDDGASVTATVTAGSYAEEYCAERSIATKPE